MSRITVAQVNARVDALVLAQQETNKLLAAIAERIAPAQPHTPAPVAEVAFDAEKAFAEPSHAGRTTRNARKSAPRKASASKAASKAETKLVSVVTLEDAQARVAAGENPWKIMVASSTTGAPIPFGKVQRALRAAERKSAGTDTAKPAKKAPAKKVTRAQADAKRVFALGSKELAALAADGDKAAQAEIARRAAKRASK